jgi:hypothetical protein
VIPHSLVLLERYKSAVCIGLTYFRFVGAECWNSDPSTGKLVITPPPANPSLYVIGRYWCVDTKNSLEAGTCDVGITDRSCSAALEAHAPYLNGSVDACRECIPGTFDNPNRWSGAVDFVQGGPCQDMRP